MVKVTIGDTEFDALTSVDYAGRYLMGDVSRAAGWALRNADAQARGIVSATRMLLSLPWCDAAPDPTSSDPIALVQEVTAMLAADLLAKPKLFNDASGNSNVKSAKAGSAQVEFFAAVEGGPPIPSALWKMLIAANLVCMPGGADDDPNGDVFVSGLGGRCRPYEGRYSDYAREGWLAEDRD